VLCSRCKIDQPRELFGPSAELWPDRRQCKPCERHLRDQRPRHGLTQDQRADIAARQGGCAICGHAEPGGKGWVVDHDRLGCCNRDKSCPKCRRGVICQWCNSVLGYAFDRTETLQAAIEYLARHASRTCEWHMPVACAPDLCGREDRDADATDARTPRTGKDGDITHLVETSSVSERARKTEISSPTGDAGAPRTAPSTRRTQ
jgi:hypothetical protein